MLFVTLTSGNAVCDINFWYYQKLLSQTTLPEVNVTNNTTRSYCHKQHYQKLLLQTTLPKVIVTNNVVLFVTIISGSVVCDNNFW
jgi:hypothetical protein